MAEVPIVLKPVRWFAEFLYDKDLRHEMVKWSYQQIYYLKKISFLVTMKNEEIAIFYVIMLLCTA